MEQAEQTAPARAEDPTDATDQARSLWEDPLRAVPLLLGYVLLLTALFLAAVVGGRRVTNPDTYFHLRYGAEFWGHWAPWDPGSVTRYATRDWVPTQWLGEVLLGRFEAWFGLPGVAWLTGAWVVGYATALCLACYRRVHGIVAGVLVLVALIASGPSLSGRPQVLSYLLVVVVVDAWLRTRADGRPRWWLVAVAWVWPLLHGMWPIGLVISLVAAVTVVVDRRRDLDLRRSTCLLALPVAMTVASALTPLGPRVFGAVATVTSRAHWYTEWGPPDYGKAAPRALAVLLLVLVVAALRQGTRASWFDVAMIALCCAFAVWSARTVTVAAATAAPLAASVLGRRRLLAPPDATQARWERRGLLTVAATTLAVLAAVVPFTASAPRTYPRWLDPTLDRLPAGTGVLTTDYDGSFLVWSHPDLDVVALGYGDVFTDAEMRQVHALFRLRPSWQDDLDRLDVHVAVLPATSPLAHALETDRHWRPTHDSGKLVYLVDPREAP